MGAAVLGVHVVEILLARVIEGGRHCSAHVQLLYNKSLYQYL